MKDLSKDPSMAEWVLIGAVSLIKDRKPEFVHDLDNCRLYRYVADGYPHYFTTCPCQGEKP